MSISARRIGDDLVVDGVDFKRLARRYKQSTAEPDFRPPQSLPEALEAVARLLGYPDLHAVNAQAKNAARAAPARLGQPQPSLTFGEPLPRDLPDWINHAWRHTAPVLVRQALIDRRPDRPEFFALVGGEGTGKSILARHMAHLLDGAVLDLEADRKELHAGYEALMAEPKPVMFFDSSTSAAERLLPLSGMMDVLKKVAAWPDRAFVFSFDSLDTVQRLLDTMSTGNGKAIFETVRVVDLEAMKVRVLVSKHPPRQLAA